MTNRPILPCLFATLLSASMSALIACNTEAGSPAAPSSDPSTPSSDPSTAQPPGAGSEPHAPTPATSGPTEGSVQPRGSSPEHGTTPDGEVFWSAINGGRYEDLPNVQKSLDAAAARLPADGYLRRLLGVSYFWQAAESPREGAGGPVRSALAALSSIRNLERAKEIAPTDPWLPCFLGLMQYEMGSKLGSASRKAEGLAEFERGIAMYPQFNTYCRALARSAAPRASAEFAEGVADFWRVIGMCDPSVTAEHPEVSDPSRMASCTQRPRVPHGYNGFWLTAGDVLTKSGDVTVGRAFYENAKKMGFDTWPQRGTLLDRIGNQLENATRYADAQTNNDPPLSFHSAHSCVMCHAR